MAKLIDILNNGFELKMNNEFFEKKYNDYLKSKDTHLYKIYRCPSKFKIKIFDDWWNRLLSLMLAYDIKIVSHNKHFFTIGATANLYEGLFFIYITPCHKYIVPIYLNITEEIGDISDLINKYKTS